MNYSRPVYRLDSTEAFLPHTQDLGQAAQDLCEKALAEAKGRLHPLLQNLELDRLDQRHEFVQAFKSALERGLARKVALWLPYVQAVFQYDEVLIKDIHKWDGSLHLLVKVPRLLDTVRTIGKRLDHSLLKQLKRLGWPRVRARQSVLEVQQVTRNELFHGVGYGAMFFAAYTAPVKVWPETRQVE